MARWKLSRIKFGDEELLFMEGEEKTIGRAIDSNVPLSSIVISRHHCVIKALKNKLTITDLKSSNGVYVGLQKIEKHTPCELKEHDVVGIGWTDGVNITDIEDKQKYMFRVSKIESMPERIKYEPDNDLEGIKNEIHDLLVKTEPSNCKGKEPFHAKVTPSKANHQEDATVSNEFSHQNKENIKDKSNSTVDVQSSDSKITPPIIKTKLSLKRKTEEQLDKLNEAGPSKRIGRIFTIDDDIIDISDSDTDNDIDIPPANNKQPTPNKMSEQPEALIKEEIKTEKDDENLEYFNIKQEHMLYDDEAILVDSESDSETEQWHIRLSQGSPGKPFFKVKRESRSQPDECSYSQIDDYNDAGEADEEYEQFEHDMITIPPQPPGEDKIQEKSGLNDQHTTADNMDICDLEDHEDFLNNLIVLEEPRLSNVGGVDPQKDIETENKVTNKRPKESNLAKQKTGTRDVVDSVNHDKSDRSPERGETNATFVFDAQVSEKGKRAQLIQAITLPQRHSSSYVFESKHKKPSSSSRRRHKHSSSKRHISNSQKEERKKKLKEIATKEKDNEQKSNQSSGNSSKDKVTVANVKVTNTNRGAFLTDTVQVVKPMNRSPQKTSKVKEKDISSAKQDHKDSKNVDAKKSEKCSTKKSHEPGVSLQEKSKFGETSKPTKHESKSNENIENHKKHSKKSKSDRNKSKHENKDESKKTPNMDSARSISEFRIPLKSLRPLSGSEVESFSGKPFSKVEPLPHTKTKKRVRFSENPPKIIFFEIEEGNKMKQTKLAKSSLLDARRKPTYSLEKINLTTVLRWNPQWLEEQKNLKEPPPILGHNNVPTAMFHTFASHSQYVQMVGDLLFMEIWECLTQGHNKARAQTGIQMRIAHLPPVPPFERWSELCTVIVNACVSQAEVKNVPRVGELMTATFGPEKTLRFFYVHHVRNLPTPQKSANSVFSISLHACYTDKMRTLKPGDVMVGVTLAYIQNELSLFEAMETLAGSPLLEAILQPDPRHFVRKEIDPARVESNYTETLNASQLRAVEQSVAAALGDRPCINMVQGPPGTGKSAVISAIVMAYFNDANRKRCRNRGKLLICATSNAAVDELVLRLLWIRRQLSKEDRFRLVRVGRTESMHPTAFDMSSQELARRDAAARSNAEIAKPGVNQEISRLEAKINMWRTQAFDAKDSVRVAYCHQRVNELVTRIALLRSGGGAGAGDELRGEQLVNAERRIIEGADVILTTLSSACNHKLRGLKRRIALCIVDEAGQAIEPEALIPLTLGVTRLTLVGDPQQLPGYICSQRAKKHGLGESLFSRLMSCAEHWPEGSNPVVFLNEQYRMHPAISDYPNRAFYGNRIKDVALPTRPNPGLPPYLILGISSGDKGQGSCGGNEMEAWGVARLVASVAGVARRAGDFSLAVITPYNGHKELIKRNLRQFHDTHSGMEIEVNTIDSFQGQERDVVVVSLARSQGVGFLTDTGRMNVMLTRAKHSLIICLNPLALVKNLQWRTLVEDAQRRNLYRLLPNRFSMGPQVGTERERDEILQYVFGTQRPGQN